MKKNVLKAIDENGNVVNTKTVLGSENKQRSTVQSLARSIDIANIGFPVIFFVLIGTYLDKYFQVRYILLVFILVGVLFTFYNLYRITKE